MHDPMNIGNPNEISVLKLTSIIKKISGCKSKIVYKRLPNDDPKVRRPDTTLAKSKLKWKAKVSLEEGLKKTIEWFKEN